MGDYSRGHNTSSLPLVQETLGASPETDAFEEALALYLDACAQDNPDKLETASVRLRGLAGKAPVEWSLLHIADMLWTYPEHKEEAAQAALCALTFSEPGSAFRDLAKKRLLSFGRAVDEVYVPPTQLEQGPRRDLMRELEADLGQWRLSHFKL